MGNVVSREGATLCAACNVVARFGGPEHLFPELENVLPLVPTDSHVEQLREPSDVGRRILAMSSRAAHRVAQPLLGAIDAALNDLTANTCFSRPAPVDEYERAATDMAMVLYWERIVEEIESRELGVTPLAWALSTLSSESHDGADTTQTSRWFITHCFHNAAFVACCRTLLPYCIHPR